MSKPGLSVIEGGRKALEEQALVACFEIDDDAFAVALRRLKPAANVLVSLVATSAVKTGLQSPAESAALLRSDGSSDSGC